jgi:hypothetical protein
LTPPLLAFGYGFSAIEQAMPYIPADFPEKLGRRSPMAASRELSWSQLDGAS